MYAYVYYCCYILFYFMGCFYFFFKLAATYRTEFHTHKMGGYMQFENTELMLIKSLAQC